MKKKFCKLSAIFIGLIMMFTVVVLPNVEAALPVDVNKKCSLEISISSHSYAEDLSKNDVQVDLYKVASISQGGNYTGLDVFKDIDWSTVKYDATQSAKTWKQRASEASKVIKDATPAYTATLKGGDVKLTNLQTGLYLIVVNDMNSQYYSYKFTPYLVSLPNNYYYTTKKDDTWYYDLVGSKAIGIKADRELRMSSIQITKKLTSQNTTLTTNATFVYQVDIETIENQKETRFITLNFDEVKEKTIRIADIPAGSKVTVTEVYTGAGYEIVGDSKKVLESLVADEDSQEIATVSFENKASSEIHGGYGIVNNYKYSKEDQDYTVKQSKENKTVQE